ncbi:MAG: S8 family serine peptidase [Crocinitomicaceae bacterium]|nr:S8 family serine peptidase [Crocinitomicaceae bacterium]
MIQCVIRKTLIPFTWARLRYKLLLLARVIIGYVDSGLDYNHADFKNADGTTRVLYYWDQTLGFDASLTPGKYGYGQVWDSTSINNGTCTSLDNNAHGTTVTGAGSGNGLATGTNKGVAPESDIIIVETNFSAPNWTLTVADAVDFIFSMADTLGKPAVVNTSVGDYLGKSRWT